MAELRQSCRKLGNWIEAQRPRKHTPTTSVRGGIKVTWKFGLCHPWNLEATKAPEGTFPRRQMGHVKLKIPVGNTTRTQGRLQTGALELAV